MGLQPSPSGRSHPHRPSVPVEARWVGALGNERFSPPSGVNLSHRRAPPSRMQDWPPSLTQAADGGWKESEFRKGASAPQPMATGPRSPAPTLTTLCLAWPVL